MQDAPGSLRILLGSLQAQCIIFDIAVRFFFFLLFGVRWRPGFSGVVEHSNHRNILDFESPAWLKRAFTSFLLVRWTFPCVHITLMLSLFISLVAFRPRPVHFFFGGKWVKKTRHLSLYFGSMCRLQGAVATSQAKLVSHQRISAFWCLSVVHLHQGPFFVFCFLAGLRWSLQKHRGSAWPV